MRGMPGRAEDVCRPGRGPPVPGLGAETGVAAVGAVPERGIRAQRYERRQPGPDPVQDRDAFLIGVDGNMDVVSAGQLLPGRQGKLFHQRVVAVAPGGVGRDRLGEVARAAILAPAFRASESA